jgi:UDP-N-acetylglucosamine 2-epimerase (non-hydrolysing)
LGCSVVAAKLSPPVRVAHVEAGLRSGDRSMPEEVNRIVTDALSDLLFTTGADADVNLRREGVARSRIHRVGNVMIDTLRRFLARSDSSDVMRRLDIAGPFALLTLHRPSNVDDEAALRRIFAALESVARVVPIVFPVHPRTLKMMRELGVGGDGGSAVAGGPSGLRLVEPLGYLDFLHLQKRARLVLTDSGGIQEEASILGVPCLTLRENTERPITISCGTNLLVGSDTQAIVGAALNVLRGKGRRPKPIPLWDGRAAERIAKVFVRVARESC